jgi:hypothetical protein
VNDLLKGKKSYKIRKFGTKVPNIENSIDCGSNAIPQLRKILTNKRSCNLFKNKSLVRNCPACKKPLFYKREHDLERAKINNTNCFSCSALKLRIK